ncbi:hypothetical protein SCHPADRAFT_941755 [Schizopora paradoxa]|uniref:Uncharacterized protein n=1 Tax=Schizopora paradoxa TaxID=27342 RepID=A0A0H2RIU3_9AGAM|nr:hypothetical protein SCHPADRAFT_941755 [Schizopora paradoxa]
MVASASSLLGGLQHALTPEDNDDGRAQVGDGSAGNGSSRRRFREVHTAHPPQSQPSTPTISRPPFVRLDDASETSSDKAGRPSLPSPSSRTTISDAASEIRVMRDESSANGSQGEGITHSQALRPNYLVIRRDRQCSRPAESHRPELAACSSAWQQDIVARETLGPGEQRGRVDGGERRTRRGGVSANGSQRRLHSTCDDDPQHALTGLSRRSSEHVERAHTPPSIHVRGSARSWIVGAASSPGRMCSSKKDRRRLSDDARPEEPDRHESSQHGLRRKTSHLSQFHRCLGRPQHEALPLQGHFPYKVVDSGNSKPVVDVTYRGETKKFMPKKSHLWSSLALPSRALSSPSPRTPTTPNVNPPRTQGRSPASTFSGLSKGPLHTVSTG